MDFSNFLVVLVQAGGKRHLFYVIFFKDNLHERIKA